MRSKFPIFIALGLGLIAPLASANTLVAWGPEYDANLQPVAFAQTGVLAGKTIVQIAAGDQHYLALCSDGTLTAWGDNSSGELGDGTKNRSTQPVLVATDTALAGKTVVKIACGYSTSFAVCSDGTVAGWGTNGSGQLGFASPSTVLKPMALYQSGAMAGKKVIEVSGGAGHSVALCSDHSLFAWGDDTYGQLGNGSSVAGHMLPTPVDQTGALAGKTVIDVEAAGLQSFVVCSDGTLFGWGDNGVAGGGPLGDGSSTQRNTPVRIGATGVLAGKKVITLAAGALHTLALCSDGTLASWGQDSNGQVGDGASLVTRSSPVDITSSGYLSGRRVTRIAASFQRSAAYCSDGTLAAWGTNNIAGGPPGTEDSPVPVAIPRSGPLTNQVDVTGLSSSRMSVFSIVEGTLPPPVASILTPAANATLLRSSFGRGTVTGSFKAPRGLTNPRILFSRSRSGVSAYWNGSAWTAAKVWLPLTILPVSSGDPLPWTWDTNVPAPAALDTGSYRVDVRASDATGSGAAATRSFSLADETTPPDVSISSPTASAKLTAAQLAGSTVEGTASDNTAVASLSVKLYRTVSDVKQYWDGISWVSASTAAPVSATGLGTANVLWHLTALPSVPTLSAGQYGVQAMATDSAGNSATVTRPFEIVSDSTKPVVTISNPLAGATVPASAFDSNTVRGTATDNLAVASVSLKLYRIRAGVKEFWNGADFVNTSTAAPVTVTGAGTASANWVLASAPTASDLDAGLYTLYATATDTSGKVSAVEVRNFNVTKTSAPKIEGSLETF